MPRLTEVPGTEPIYTGIIYDKDITVTKRVKEHAESQVAVLNEIISHPKFLVGHIMAYGPNTSYTPKLFSSIFFVQLFRPDTYRYAAVHHGAIGSGSYYDLSEKARLLEDVHTQLLWFHRSINPKFKSMALADRFAKLGQNHELWTFSFGRLVTNENGPALVDPSQAEIEAISFASRRKTPA